MEICEADEDGVYGITEGPDITVEVVDFAYALETVPGTTDAEVEQIIDDLEDEIAASVIQRLAPECDEESTRRLGQQENQDGTRQLNRNEQSHAQQRRLVQVLVGLSPKPDDERITDRPCDRDVGDNRCDLVRAGVTIYTRDDGTRRRLQEAVVEESTGRRAQTNPVVGEVSGAIQAGMDDGDFNDNEGRSTDSVVSVEWVPLEDLEEEPSSAPRSIDTDDGLDILWIIVICCGGALVCLLIAAAYLCTRRPSSVDSEPVQRDVKPDLVTNSAYRGSGGGTSTNYGGRNTNSDGARNTNYGQEDESEEESESERQLGRFQQTDTGRSSF